MTRFPATFTGRSVLVVGPGWLGAPIAEQLQHAGARVFTMQRTQRPAPTSPASETASGLAATEPIVAIVGDITTAAVSPAVCAALPDTIDHLVLCIAPSRSRGDTHSSSYPAAARGAIALAVARHARSVLYTSSTGVYGRTAGELVDETTPLHPEDERQQALIDAELALWNDAAPHEMGAIVLRVAGLYGPGRDPGRRFGDPATVADGGETWSNFSWRDDVADAVLHLLHDSTLERGAHCFNCTDGQPMQAKTIARSLGVDVTAAMTAVDNAPGDAPGDAARSGASSRASSERSGTVPLRRRARKSNQRISIALLLATGWTPSVPTVLDGLERLGHRVTRASTTT